jgi:hypothetical protein
MQAAPIVEDFPPVLTRDILAAIADRPNEPEASRAARADAALRLIEAFAPQDAVDIMLAGQSVLFETLALDAIADARRAATPELALKCRAQAMALARVQLSFHSELARRRKARAKEESPPGQPETPARSEPAPKAPPPVPPRTQSPIRVQPPAIERPAPPFRSSLAASVALAALNASPPTPPPRP